MKIVDITAQVPKNPNYPRIPLRDKKKLKYLVWHCSAAPPSFGVWDLVRYDLAPNHISKRGCPCPTYAYYIEADGTVYKTAQIAWKTWHVGVWNPVALGICLAYEGKGEPPPQAQLDAALELTVQLCREWGFDPKNVVGHRELPYTGYNPKTKRLRKACPGLQIDMDCVRREVASRLDTGQAADAAGG
jgi:hypothetical protein